MKKFGESVKSIVITVDDNSNVSKCPSAEIDRMRAANKNKVISLDIDRDFTMRNFGTSVDKLEFGKEYVVDFIPIADTAVATVRESLEYLKKNGYLIVSGTIHPYLKDRSAVPCDKWLASIDVEKNLFRRDGHDYFSCCRIDSSDACYQVQLAVASAGLNKNYYLIGVRKA